MLKEDWKFIDGYNRYMVSSLGVVFSLDSDKAMSLQKRTDGYLAVTIKSGCSRKTFLVHRLVANAFLNKVFGKNEVNHIDGDKANNNATNLEWCTRSENQKHSHVIGAASNAGLKNPRCKLSTRDTALIINMLRCGVRRIDIAKEFEVSKSTIAKIAKGEHWTCPLHKVRPYK